MVGHLCTESVHSTDCARAALVITVGSSAHVRAVERLNEHHVIHVFLMTNDIDHAR